MRYGWARSLVSLACYSLGCLFFSRWGFLVGPLRRIFQTSSFLLQFIFVVVAAASVQTGVTAGDVPADLANGMWQDLVPITLLSFQSGGQIVASRQLGFDEISTVVVTSMVGDLFADRALLAPLKENAKRNRRIASFVLTLIGAIAGGLIAKAARSITPVLWIVAFLKLGISVTWLFWWEKGARDM